MPNEKFEPSSAKLITKENLVKLDLYISTLGYLEEGFLYDVELLDGGTKENKQMIRLNTAVAIPDNNQ